MRRLTPLEQWICDVCGDVIEHRSEGCVVWRREIDGDNSLDYDFHVIHQVRCDLNSRYSCSLAIDTYLGADGLAYLMSMLSPGPLIGPGSVEVRDLNEFVDFVRRMQTPYYEQARRYFCDEDIQERFAGENEVSPYRPETLRSIVEAKCSS